MGLRTRQSLYGTIGHPWSAEQGGGPNLFVFNTQTGLALSQAAVASNEIIISGVNPGSTISVAGDAGYGYSLNGGGLQTIDGVVNDGDTLSVAVDSSGSYNAGTSVTVTINSVVVTFIVVTIRDPAAASQERAPITRLHSRR